MHFCIAAWCIGERNGEYGEHHHRCDENKFFHDFKIECLINNELIKLCQAVNIKQREGASLRTSIQAGRPCHGEPIFFQHLMEIKSPVSRLLFSKSGYRCSRSYFGKQPDRIASSQNGNRANPWSFRDSIYPMHFFACRLHSLP